MLSPWFAAGSAARGMDDVVREMEALFRQLEPARIRTPKVNVVETEEVWTLSRDIPGLRPDEVTVTVQGSRLTLAGERKLSAPEGYTVQLRERPNFSFQESFQLPRLANPEGVTATVRDGTLTVQVPLGPEARPRAIPVVHS